MVFLCLGMITLFNHVDPEVLFSAGFSEDGMSDIHQINSDGRNFAAYTGTLVDANGEYLNLAVIEQENKNGKPVRFYFGSFVHPPVYDGNEREQREYFEKLWGLIRKENAVKSRDLDMVIRVKVDKATYLN